MFVEKYASRALSLILIAVAALAVNTANAQISYDYAELRYLSSDRGAADTDGIEIAGSYQFDEDWLVLGSYASEGGDTDVDVFEVGVGYLLPDVEGINLMTSISILDIDVGNASENGFRLALLGRKMLTEELEGRASINYVDSFDTDLFFELGVDYFITPRFAAGAELQIGSDTDTISIGGRWYFNN